jgi:NAD-dependent deacetylase
MREAFFMNPLDDLLQTIQSSRPDRVVVLTGAGVSAESGIPTFRGAGGMWENHRPEQLATPEAFEHDPGMVWRWYEWRRKLVAEAQPNKAHLALAHLERALGRDSVLVATQNVDGLHQRAGSRNVLELHGSITRVRCTRDGTRSDHPQPFTNLPPRCDCGALLRPDVVWFGEALPEGAIERAAAAVRGADMLLVIGTSGVVYPAAGLVHLATRAIPVEINPDPTPLTSVCHFAIRSSAAEATPLIVQAIVEAEP